MLNLKQQQKLEKLPGQTLMYRGTPYRFNGHVIAGDRIIFSTDVKPLNIAAEKFDAFIAELLPCDTLPPINTAEAHELPAINITHLGEITDSLMTDLRLLDSLKDDADIKRAHKRVKHKVAISKAVTDIAKTHLIAQRFRNQ